ncbi:MAG: SAM-dependent methyltransferase [Anaerolineales bacterium]
MKSSPGRHPASFRDPNGFLFRRDGILYRQVNQRYRENYQALMQALYIDLVDEDLLIPHTEVEIEPADPADSFRVLQPEPIPFLTYPYEWSFAQLKDAALATLAIQERALAAGMTLKDASAYNIQFHKGRPILIDTLSFESRVEGEPWVAYRQFCQHFLAPLALMALKDIRLGQFLRLYIDGVPLDLAASLLPRRTLLNFGLLVHLHIHAGAQRRFAGREVKSQDRRGAVGERSMQGMVENLRGTIQGLKWQAAGSWSDYYDFHSYDETAFDHKQQLVSEFLEAVSPESALDLGANQGVFSRLASERGAFTVSADIDPGAVQRNYLHMKKQGEENLLPMLIDLTNPSPALGWAHQERESLMARGDFDVTMALALVHHLAISNNLPLPLLANFFAELSPWLIIEFVPKSDGQVQKLLASREDIFEDYHQEDFEAAFKRKFKIKKGQRIEGMDRTLYLLERATT